MRKTENKGVNRTNVCYEIESTKEIRKKEKKGKVVIRVAVFDRSVDGTP
jgi:hypothetical protein